MSVDVQGLDPFLKRDIPTRPPNTASNEEFAHYFHSMYELELENPGFRFSASWWNWRPIAWLMTEIIEKHDLNVSSEIVSSFNFNDGLGIQSPEICRIISKHIDELIEKMKSADSELLCLKSPYWYYKTVGKNGSIINATVADENLIKQLDEKVEALYYMLPEIDGVEYHSPHQTDLNSLEKFSAFLKECNGFKIY
jgi:hypothetical protein